MPVSPAASVYPAARAMRRAKSSAVKGAGLVVTAIARPAPFASGKCGREVRTGRIGHTRPGRTHVDMAHMSFNGVPARPSGAAP